MLSLLRSFFALTCSALLLFSACQPPERTPPLYEASGTILGITPNRSFVEIDHAPIEGFMNAMVMRFPVADTALLAGFSASDSVQFTIQEGPIGYQIMAIERVQ